MIKTFYLYLAKNFFLNLMIVLGIVISIVFIIDLMEFSKRFGHLVSGPVATFKYVGLHYLPSHLHRSMPFIVLIASIMTFFRLNVRNELIMFRVSGMSVLGLIGVVSTFVFALGLIYLFVITPIFAYSMKRYEQFESRLTDDDSNFLISSSGLWFKDDSEEGVVKIIHAIKIEQDKNLALNIQAFLYNNGERFVTHINSKVAEIVNGQCTFYDANITDSKLNYRKKARYTIPLNVDISELEYSLGNPETIPFWKLDKAIKLGQNSGFPTLFYEVYYYSLISMPFVFASMASFGALFAFTHVKKKLWSRCCMGVFFGLVIYFINNVFRAFALLTTLPLWLVVIAPYIILVLVTIYLAVMIEEGSI